MKTQPLVRALTDAGYGSRRRVAGLVKQGVVQVNGRIASSFMEPVDIERDTVSVSGRDAGLLRPRRIYIMMHKPMDVLSTTEDDRGRKTIMDLLPDKFRQAGLYPAGRLDQDSTGLLILTNDGDMAHELTHPRYEHEKEYEVATSRPLTPVDIRHLEDGVDLDGQPTWPARVHVVKESEADEEYVYSITIHEGRKRQVRRMLRALRHEVTSLRRVRIGSLKLGALPEGEARELNDKELKALMRRGAPPSRPESGPARRGHPTPRGTGRQSTAEERVQRSAARRTGPSPAAQKGGVGSQPRPDEPSRAGSARRSEWRSPTRKPEGRVDSPGARAIATGGESRRRQSTVKRSMKVDGAESGTRSYRGHEPSRFRGRRSSTEDGPQRPGMPSTARGQRRPHKSMPDRARREAAGGSREGQAADGTVSRRQSGAPQRRGRPEHPDHARPRHTSREAGRRPPGAHR